MLPIVEIFLSIEGEGIRSGRLCTFIRVAGCNLRCSYCDTRYSFDVNNAKQMTIEQIMEQVNELGCKTVTLTGGEPLLYKETGKLIEQLLKDGYKINVETNGSIDIDAIKRTPTDDLMFTIDWKSPSSKMEDKMQAINFKRATSRDVFKFVVGDTNDLIAMAYVLKGHPTRAHIYVSPVFGQIQLEDIVNFMKNNKFNGVTLQIQLHKLIWDPNKRGV